VCVLHLVQRGGTGRGRSPPRPLFAVQNVTAHPSTASAPITVLLYGGPLLCGFNVPIKGYGNPRVGIGTVVCRQLRDTTRTLLPGYLENYAFSLLRCIKRNVQRGMRVILVLVLCESIGFFAKIMHQK